MEYHILCSSAECEEKSFTRVLHLEWYKAKYIKKIWKLNHMQYILSTQPAKVAGICSAHNAERFTHPERSPCKSGMRKSVLFLARGVGVGGGRRRRVVMGCTPPWRDGRASVCGGRGREARRPHGHLGGRENPQTHDNHKRPWLMSPAKWHVAASALTTRGVCVGGRGYSPLSSLRSNADMCGYMYGHVCVLGVLCICVNE